MIDLNLVSLIQQGEHKKRRINLLVLSLTLFLLVILNYQQHGFKMQKGTSKAIPVTSNLPSDLNTAEADQKVIASKSEIDDCASAKRDLKLVGAVLDDASTLALFKQVSSERIVSFSKDVKVSRSKGNEALHQEGSWDLMLNWKGCAISFSF